MTRTGRLTGAPLRHKLCLAAILSILAGMLWPGYLPALRVEPYVLGLPFAYAWIVGCIAAAFIVLLVTYRADRHAAAKQSDDSSRRAR
ncbi:MAG TPA: DUF3311 domain-containing protein [Gammaproteobacteria bacterium]|nr:DUF3311 domain-containing protein [Gammaproteobacteria bacterium]